MRLEFAYDHVELPETHWEKIWCSDEKWFSLDGYCNVSQQCVRETSSAVRQRYFISDELGFKEILHLESDEMNFKSNIYNMHPDIYNYDFKS